MGYHRPPVGKALTYRFDANLPFTVRGPGVPANTVSRLPGTYLDATQIFLDTGITGLDRDQWQVFTNISQAMDPQHDTFFASLIDVNFFAYLDYQDTANEAPYYSLRPESLGGKYRRDTKRFRTLNTNGIEIKGNYAKAGSWKQRNHTLEDILQKARELTAEEIGVI